MASCHLIPPLDCLNVSLCVLVSLPRMQMRAHAEACSNTLHANIHTFVKEHHTDDASEGGARGVEAAVSGCRAQLMNSAERDSNVPSRCCGDHHHIFKWTCVKKNNKYNTHCAGMKGLYTML